MLLYYFIVIFLISVLWSIIVALGCFRALILLTTMEDKGRLEQELQQKRIQLKTLQEKCDLQSKKIKLYRKENEEIKQALVRQAQLDTSLLLASKDLSDANTKLQSAIQDITLKLDIDLDSTGTAPQLKASRPVSLVTIQNTTVTEETEEIDLPGQEVTDEDIQQLQYFRGLKSLLLGENKIGEAGVRVITDCLPNLTKLQLNSNTFPASALANIANLQQLRVLDVRNNALGDDCLKHLASLPNLQELSLSKNGITDAGMPFLARLTTLLYLDFTTNQITDEGAKHLMGLSKLTHLYLMSNRVTETTVFLAYESLTKLEVLDVRFNINDPTKKEILKAQKPSKLQLFC